MSEKTEESQEPDLRRRCKVLYLDAGFLLAAVASKHWFQMTAEVPEGAEMVAIAPDWDRQAIRLLVRHESFPETPLSEDYPALGILEIEYLPQQETSGRRCAFADHCERPAEVVGPWNGHGYCAAHYKTLQAHSDPPLERAARVTS